MPAHGLPRESAFGGALRAGIHALNRNKAATLEGDDTVKRNTVLRRWCPKVPSD